VVNGFSVLEKCDSGKFYHEDRESMYILNVGKHITGHMALLG
jgi:hypothetical protein